MTEIPSLGLEHAEYFFYKNGGGNAWMAYSLEHAELYVGFNREWAKLSKRASGPEFPTDLDYICEGHVNASAVKEDVRTLVALWKSRNDPGKNSFLLTFTPTTLLVWRVVGPLREHQPGTERWKAARAYWESLCDHLLPCDPRDLPSKQVKKQRREGLIREGLLSQTGLDQLQKHAEFEPRGSTLPKGKVKKTIEERLGDRYAIWSKLPEGAEGLPIRFLPAQLVASIPRRDLFTSVDSISVYRNLNSNTCTSLRSVTGTDPTQAADENSPWPLPNDTSSPLGPIPEDAVSPQFPQKREKPFGQFLRLYLNGMVTRHWNHDAAGSPPRLPMLPHDAAEAALPLLLNPILVETAALALVRDLGLTPDVGVGKGMDVVDIRARAVGPDGLKCEERAACAANRMASLVATTAQGGPNQGAWASRLRDDGVLELQCKASGSRITTGPDSLVFVGYPDRDTKEHDRPPTVSIPDLARWSRRPGAETSELARFFAMQRAVLCGHWGTSPAQSQDSDEPHDAQGRCPTP